MRVSRCVPGTDRVASRTSLSPDGVEVVASPFFTDAKRLRALALPRGALMTVLRPAALLLPADVLRATLERARQAQLDVAMVDGVPPEVFYVASARAHAMAEAAGAVAGAVTIPQAIERLRRLGLSVREVPLAVARLAPEDVGWPDRALAEALDGSAWKEWPAAPLLELDSRSRLAAALRAHDEDRARDRERLRRARGPATCDGMDRRRSVLVTVPAMYQSGANAAWEEMLTALPADDIAFVCGRDTALRRLLDARGFTTWQTTDGMGPRSARDAAVFLEALHTVRPDVIHFDGAEGSTWAPVAFARGTRIVQHVRLNELERFQPAFAFADAIVAVAPHLQQRIAARLGPSARVEHIADGIDLQARVPVAYGRPADGRVRCLCVGRIEPEKGTTQVLDISRALAALVPCDLLVVGSCGHDPAYCDAFTADVLAAAPPLTATWRSFTHPIHALYAHADVVLVGSRNEALGMVGLEALAAGCLLVARRSAGYACIVDESRDEGLLFDGSDAPAVVAARIVEALGERERFAVGGRRKVESTFDARNTAERLLALWRDLARAST
ncbi:Spore coat protein SA [Luteitalea pratensis]|uniref:Spore coat protein SA n=1 Tax=Luteitalea pratensis TaxID=1855912 RepID=A0A143PMR0_LUTPR|nr:Spore coat protein SA [Luteitalea pratensis]